MVLPDTIALDTETTSLFPRNGHMFSIQIGTGENNYIIDMQQLGGEIVFDDVRQFLEGKTLVGHNITFDLGWLYKEDFYPKRVFDTFIASKILYNGLGYVRHDFGTVMKRELEVYYDKTEQANIHKTQLKNSAAIQYAFNDVDRLLELMQVLGGKIRKAGSLETYLLHCQYVRALAYMEQCGLPFSSERWMEKIEQDKIAVVEAHNKVVEYIYDNLPQFRDRQIDIFSSEKKILPMLSSQKQMIPVFQALGINIQSDDDPNKLSIKEDVIKRSGHEFIDLWLDFKGAEHDVSTYGENILEKVYEGRIYTTFNPILDTARISTRKGGVNILNFPANARTRRCVKASEGFKMIVADYEGQENAVGADLHKDPMMLASLKEGLDLHCAFARLIFPELEGLSDEEIMAQHKDKRQFAKSPRFAKAYGGAGFTIAKNLNISEAEGGRLSQLYDQLHPKVKEWGELGVVDCINNGYIESASGFKLYIEYFDDFRELHDLIADLSKDFWEQYMDGKKAVKALEKGVDDVNFERKYHSQIELYHKWRSKISSYFSKKGRLYRLALNNPVQATSAHQTKKAAVMLFDEISRNGDFGNVRICNIPHDEFVLEVREDLAEKYARILEKCMVEGGNYFLQSGLVDMKAEANVGDDWYEAK
jgi:DNA polymerase I